VNDPTQRPTNGTDQSPPETSDRFEVAFRAWAANAPATPAHQAGRRIAERLPMRTRFPEIRRLAVAAALVAAIGTALVLRWTGLPGGDDAHPSSDTAPVVPTTGTAATPDGDVLVIDLDPQTPLYLNLSGPGR